MPALRLEIEVAEAFFLELWVSLSAVGRRQEIEDEQEESGGHHYHEEHGRGAESSTRDLESVAKKGSVQVLQQVNDYTILRRRLKRIMLMMLACITKASSACSTVLHPSTNIQLVLFLMNEHQQYLHPFLMTNNSHTLERCVFLHIGHSLSANLFSASDACPKDMHEAVSLLIITE